jgi:hypothetical protein
MQYAQMEWSTVNGCSRRPVPSFVGRYVMPTAHTTVDYPRLFPRLDISIVGYPGPAFPHEEPNVKRWQHPDIAAERSTIYPLLGQYLSRNLESGTEQRGEPLSFQYCKYMMRRIPPLKLSVPTLIHSGEEHVSKSSRL